MPCPTTNSFPDIIAVAVCRHWCLAGVSESIAMPANGRDVGSVIGTAISSRGEMFCCAPNLARQTIANSVRAGKFLGITDAHIALAVIAKRSLVHVCTGTMAGNSTCHGFDGPSWPPSPRLGTGREPAVNHRLGQSALPSIREPGISILHTFEGNSPAGEILFNRRVRVHPSSHYAPVDPL